MALLAIVVVFSYMANVNAQNTGPNTGAGVVSPPCDDDVTAASAAVDQTINSLPVDANGNVIPPPDVDLNCGGRCQDGKIKINGVLYTATWEKAICVATLLQHGITNPSCWVDVCASLGTSDLGEIRMNEDEGALPSRVKLTSVKGEGPFEFPATVRIEFFAKLDVMGLPTMTNSEPMVLEATEPINEWPPKSEVHYRLAQSVEFVTDDGEHNASFEEATVIMNNRGFMVSSK